LDPYVFELYNSKTDLFSSVRKKIVGILIKIEKNEWYLKNFASIEMLGI
jgi:hypothetical protein